MKSFSALLLAVVTTALLGSHASVSALLSVEETEVEVIPNPHAKRRCAESPQPQTKSSHPQQCSSPKCAPKLLLSPHRILRHIIPTQSDTFVRIERKKVLGVPVPVYQFRQPARLSAAQLPFKLILVADIDVRTGLNEIPTDPIRASDSWFPGYRWAPVMCSSCDEHVHVGWKFTNPSDPSGDFFYALIVEASERRNGEGIAVGALGDVVADAVEVGMRAPGWMLSALAKVI